MFPTQGPGVPVTRSTFSASVSWLTKLDACSKADDQSRPVALAFGDRVVGLVDRSMPFRRFLATYGWDKPADWSRTLNGPMSDLQRSDHCQRSCCCSVHLQRRRMSVRLPHRAASDCEGPSCRKRREHRGTRVECEVHLPRAVRALCAIMYATAGSRRLPQGHDGGANAP
jgi:hypothetical protein